MRSVHALVFFAFLGIVLAIAGCQDQTAEVSGFVTVDGKPITKGSIGFVPADLKGQTAGGEIIDGKYSVKVGIGEMKVEIRYPKVTGKKKDYDAPGGKYYETSDESLPAKYNDQTELKMEVKPGKNEKNWDLTR